MAETTGYETTEAPEATSYEATSHEPATNGYDATGAAAANGYDASANGGYAAVAATASPVDDLHRNLIVFFIPRDWDDAALKAYFESYGTVETCKVMMDRTTGTSRGFGFVKFASRSNAESCILAANGAEVGCGGCWVVAFW